LAPYGEITGTPGFVTSLLLSLGLAAATIVVVLALTLPAMIAVRLGASRLRSVLEVLCTLPLVVPPIAFVAGVSTVLQWGPDHLSDTPLYTTFFAVQSEAFPVVLVLAYVVMALPFVYRSLDAGLRALDLPTLVEAGRNCGAGWWQIVFRIVLPNLKPAIASAAFLTLALVLGEYTVARILNFETFSVWIVKISGSDARLSVAVSVFSLLVTWVLLLTLSGTGTRSANARKE
jgi:putative spermidine/putrescine transport system permease protein